MNPQWLLLSALLLACPTAAQIRAVDCITQAIDNHITVTRPGNRHPLARPANDAGVAYPDLPMNKMILVLEPDPSRQASLDALLEAQQDPLSPRYHQWLTPERFGELYGVSEKDLSQIAGWLESNGFQVDPLPPGRRSIVFSGTASQVASAFHTEIHVYDVDGVLHYANADDPAVPAALADVVLGVASLHDFRAKPAHHVLATTPTSVPEYTSGSAHYLAPADFATIYDAAPLYAGSIDGTGQSIAIVGRTNINLSDVQTFRSAFALPANMPTVVVNGPDPGIVSTDEVMEALLDVEWSGAVARNAKIQFVVSASTNTTDGILLSAEYVVNHNVAPAMSTSFGNCESALGTSGNAAWNALWQQAAAEGITVLVASGDSGAAGCDTSSETKATGGVAVNGLCSTPYSTCAGGSQFADVSNPSQYWSTTSNSNNLASALSYIPEVAWNESGSTGLWASGGGVSKIYSKPSWQAGPGVPSAGARDVPDVSLAAAAHDGYMVRANGVFYIVSGTSAASPSFAGLMALAIQKQNARIGNANPVLYGLASKQASGGAPVFHDITAGNNSVPGVTGYTAGPGYDLATGLGSVDASAMVNHWNDTVTTPAFQLSLSAAAVSIVKGTSAAVTVNIAVSGGFNSAVSLSAGTLPAGVTAAFTPASMAPGSRSSTLTLSAAAGSSSGTFNLTISASGGGITRTAATSLTITQPPPCTYTINPASVSATAAAATYSTAVTTTPGCSWTAASNSNWITVTGGASGSGSGSVSYSVAANSTPASRTASITIAGLGVVLMQAAAPPPPATFSLSAAAANFNATAASGSVNVTASSNSSTWTAVSNVPWVAIAGAGSFTGSKPVTYSVSANTSPSARTGTLTIAGLTFTVTQAGVACSYSALPGALTPAPAGINGTIIVTTAAGCAWTASSSAAWLSITAGATGNGSATLNFFAATNNTSSARSATLTVAGNAITITEAKSTSR